MLFFRNSSIAAPVNHVTLATVPMFGSPSQFLRDLVPDSVVEEGLGFADSHALKCARRRYDEPVYDWV